MSEQDVVKKLLLSLHNQLQIKSQPKCLELIAIITEYFGGPLTASEIRKFFLSIATTDKTIKEMSTT